MKGFIKNFNLYINENFGAITIERNPPEKFMHEPDVKRPTALAFYTGAAGKIPAHWDNSPFLSGGAFGPSSTNQFGSNPRVKKANHQRKVYSFHDFIEVSKESSKK